MKDTAIVLAEVILIIAVILGLFIVGDLVATRHSICNGDPLPMSIANTVPELWIN